MSQTSPHAIDSIHPIDPIEPTTTTSTEPTATKARHQSSLWQTKLQDPTLAALADYTPRDLARALLEQLRVDERDWHRLKGDRRIRAREQVAAALVFMLADNTDEARQRLTHALDWLDRRVSAPPCPDHSSRASLKPNSTQPTPQSETP